MLCERPYKPNYHHRESYSKGHQYELISPKIANRSIHLFTKNEFNHYLLVESDPKVKTFCEQPDLEIISSHGSRRVRTNFDMWIKWEDGREEFRRIESHDDAEEFKNNPESNPHLLALETWAKSNHAEYKIYTDEIITSTPVFLENWSQIMPYLHDTSWIIEHGLEKKVLLFAKSCNEVSIQNILNNFSDLEPTEVVRSIFWNLYIGNIESDLKRSKLSQQTTFKLTHHA